jgi:hypothetical protein
MAFLFFPANCICPGTDNIVKTYYDRGVFDKQSCLWSVGWFGGEPKFVNQVVSEEVFRI